MKCRVKNLAEWVGEWNPRTIVHEFARAVKKFHEIDTTALFPNNKTSGLIALHGDMALPNIICAEPGTYSY